MNAKDVQSETAAALSREEPLSFAECNTLLLNMSGALGEIGERVARITPGDKIGNVPVGIEYRRALQTGSAEDVERLGEEFKAMSVLLNQLQAQRDELSTRRLDARFREAQANLPGLQSSLVKRLDDVEQAKADLERKVAALVDTGTQITQARSIVRERHQEPEGGATVRTLQRLSRLADVLPGQISRHSNWWIDTIGCAVSERVWKDAMVKAPDADYSDCSSDEEIRRVAVESLFGPWSEDDAEIAYAFASLPNAKERMAA